MSNALHVISLGAGVQSTALLLMALAGEFTPAPDAAIFADTGWEPPAVYTHLDWLEREVAGQIPLLRVGSGRLRQTVIAFAEGRNRRGWRIPLHLRHVSGRSGQMARQCTQEYKVRPINRAIGRLLRTRGLTDAVVWMGISADEAHRMKPSREPGIQRRYPLVEARVTRDDCLRWMAARGHPRPPKSACIGCPYHGAAEWLAVKADPVAWADAVAFDAAIRQLPGSPAEYYLHRSLRPLPMVEFRGERDDLGAECEGVCGV